MNVMARISNGDSPFSEISQAMRWVSTRVLPEPAPATTSSGPSAWATASACAGLSPDRRSNLGAMGSAGSPAAALKRSITIAPTNLPAGCDRPGYGGRPIRRQECPP